MTKAGWMMLAVVLIAAASGCARTQETVIASTGTSVYGSSTLPAGFDTLTDVYHTDRVSARQNF